MKLQQVNAALYLARIQATSHQKAAKDQRLSFERAALWYLNQAQDELVNALREHHGLRGQANETQTLKELAARNLPSAAGDQILAWPYWGACRKAAAPTSQATGAAMINAVDEDQALIKQAMQTGYQDWIDSLSALCLSLQSAYAEY